LSGLDLGKLHFLEVCIDICRLGRRRDPNGSRKFSTPLPWLIGPLAIGGCIYLFWSLPGMTKLFFGLWNLLGLALYVWVGRSAATGKA